MTQQRLTLAEANEIGGAIHQLTELNTKSIVEKDDAATKRALTTFIQNKLLLHAEEFLMAWFTLKQEYEPYLSAQASMLGNVMMIIQRRQQIMEAQAKAQAEVAKPAEQPEGGTSKEQAPGYFEKSEPKQEPANVIQLNAK
jgi:hypothetical protein